MQAPVPQLPLVMDRSTLCSSSESMFSPTSFANALMVPGLAQACMQALNPYNHRSTDTSRVPSLRTLRLLCRGSRDAVYNVVQRYTVTLTDPALKPEWLNPKLVEFLLKCRLLSLCITIPSIESAAGAHFPCATNSC